MRKLLAFLSAGLVVAAISGCGLSPTDAPQFTIDPIGSIARPASNSVTKSVTGKVEAGDVITAISYDILNSNDVSVSTIKISVSGPAANSAKELDFNGNLIITVYSTADTGTYKLKISVTGGSSVDGTFNFTVTGTGGAAVTTYIDTLGANQNTTYGSSIDLDGPVVYKAAASNSHVSEIDLCYAYSAVVPTGEFLFSPDQAEVSGYDFTLGWTTTPNSTKFYKTSLTPTQFNAITLQSEVTALWTQPAGATPYVACSANDVFIAKTDQNAIVLILITAQTAGNAGTISLKIAK
jgi:hypothetical protein